MAYVLKSDRIGLRRMNENDLDEMALLLGDAEVMAHYPRPKTRAEAEAWINWNLDLYDKHGFGLWAMESLDDGQFLGDCGLTPQVVDGVTEIEIGYHVHRRFWGNGFASEGAELCVKYARSVLLINQVVALMVPGNVASQRVAEKAGLTFDRLGDYKAKSDVVVMKVVFDDEAHSFS